jgi:hypothetical protein
MRALSHSPNNRTALLACYRCGAPARLPPPSGREHEIHDPAPSQSYRGLQRKRLLQAVQRPFSVAAGAPNRASSAEKTDSLAPPPPSVPIGVSHEKYSQLFTKRSFP